MNDQAFKAAYEESRNGVNQFYQHPLFRFFIYSDGVRECALAGCYWLLDQIAPQSKELFAKHQGENLLSVTVVSKDRKATITYSGSGDVPLDTKEIDFTDLTEGTWIFYVADDGDKYITMILPKEY